MDSGRDIDDSEPKLDFVLNSQYTLPLLKGIKAGKTIAGVAEDLGCDPQLLTYHTNRICEMAFVTKQGDGPATRFTLTDKGEVALSVLAKHGRGQRGVTRLHHTAFKFHCRFVQLSEDLSWAPMKNDVMKHTQMYYANGVNVAVELFRSRNTLTMNVYCRTIYCYDLFSAFLQQYQEAVQIAKSFAQNLGTEPLDSGKLFQSPHIALSDDLVSRFLADCNIKGAKIGNDEVWVDRSNGSGELETDSMTFWELYFQMPYKVAEMHKKLDAVEKKVAMLGDGHDNQ